MGMHINGVLQLNKSRLAGFFLLLLLQACTDNTPVAENLSLQQAKRAEQRGLPLQATRLYQQAAQQGEVAALQPLLRLHRPQIGYQQFELWLQQTPFNQAQLQPVLAAMGRWQQLPGVVASDYQRRWQTPALTLPDCALRIQPVVSTQISAQSWATLRQQWSADRQLSTLNLCFLPPVFVDSASLSCSEQSEQRIQCQLRPLQQLIEQYQPTQILLLSGTGLASFNNGIIQLPETASLALLRHELSHLFEFLDEYPLAAAVAKTECQVGRITPNLLFSKADLASYLRAWQLAAEQVTLTAVDTCVQVGIQAYRVVSVDSHLQHYELLMPELYLQLMHKQLQQPAKLMPVAYYFAYLARQRQDWPSWTKMMQLAAASGYPPAQAALAEATIGQHNIAR